MCHTYIYSIGPTPKSVEYQFFGQFPKFPELPRQFSPDMSGPDMSESWVSSLYKGAECPLEPQASFSSSTPSLAAVKCSLGNFESSPPNPFGF
jgi:hypothetical protein